MMLPPAVNEKDNLYVKLKKGKTAEGLAYIKNTFAKFDAENAADFNFLDETFARQYAKEQKPDNQTRQNAYFTLCASVF